MNEISVGTTLTCSKSGATVTGSQTKLITLAGIGQWSTVMVIGTTPAEQISYPTDLTNEGVGYVWIKNQDATNNVEVALDSAMANKFALLLPGEVAIFRAAITTPVHYLRAITASCNCQIVAVGT